MTDFGFLKNYSQRGREIISILHRDFPIMVNIPDNNTELPFKWLKERIGKDADWIGGVTTDTETLQYRNIDGVWDSYGYSPVFFKESVDLKTIIEFKLMFG